MVHYRWRTSPPSWAPVGRPTVVSVVAQNRLAAVRWTPPGGTISTTVTATATGQPTVSVTVPGSATSVVLDGIAPIDTAGASVTWTITVTCLDSAGWTRTASVQVIPQLVKPNPNITGVPVGAAGDIRTPVPSGYAGLTPITAAAMVSTLTQTAGATITGYDVDCTASSVFLYAHDITFRNCRFTGISAQSAPQVGTNGGGVWRRCKFIDCEFDGQGTTTLTGSIPANTSHNAGVWPPRSFIRCRLGGFVHLIDQHVGDVRHCLLDNVVYWPGPNPPASQSHSDVLQWFNATAGPGSTIGPTIIQGCTMDSTTPSQNSLTQCGPWAGTNPNDMVVLLFERNWCNYSCMGYYFGGSWPARNVQDPSQVVFRGNKFGLSVSSVGMFYPNWRNSVTWAGDNTWEVTGTNSLGQSVVAGQVIP